MEIPSIQLSLEHIEELDFYRIAVVYKIEKLKDFVKLENSQVTVDTRLLALLLSISIGSMRGMLALRTQNTVFKNYPLPLINVSEILTSMNITDSEGIWENLNIYYNN